MDAERTRVQANGDGSWQKITVSLMVPQDAEHISFGCYSKNRIVKVRNGSFNEVNLKEAAIEASSLGHDAVLDVPFNLLIVPGYKIESAPINLDFRDSPSDSVRVAEHPKE